MAALSARDARIAAGGTVLLEHVTFEVERGELIAVLGANGAGKTTLLRTIAGLHALAGGRIEVMGREPAALSPRDRARAIACSFADEAPAETLTVWEALESARFPFHRWWDWSMSSADASAIDGALAAARLAGLRERAVATLSAGERQRLWLAVALAQEAPVVLLDEPTSHLDARYAFEILGLLRTLRSERRAIVAVLHDLNEAALYADRALLLGNGGIVAWGEPAAVLTPDNILRAYGVEVEVLAGEPGGRPRILPRRPA